MAFSWTDIADRHADETGIVIGNGPSLRHAPREFLESLPSFGANRIYLLEDFAPTYYVSINRHVVDQFGLEAVSRLDGATELFFMRARSVTPELAAASGAVVPTDSMYSPGPDDWADAQAVFSSDPARGVGEGWTVTFVSLQLAYFMGFSRILLVGVDHHFAQSKEREYAPNELIAGFDAGDSNHFNPAYF